MSQCKIRAVATSISSTEKLHCHKFSSLFCSFLVDSPVTVVCYQDDTFFFVHMRFFSSFFFSCVSLTQCSFPSSSSVFFVIVLIKVEQVRTFARACTNDSNTLAMSSFHFNSSSLVDADARIGRDIEKEIVCNLPRRVLE